MFVNAFSHVPVAKLRGTIKLQTKKIVSFQNQQRTTFISGLQHSTVSNLIK